MMLSHTSKKGKDGFHVVVEVLDKSIALSLLAVRAASFGAVANVSLSHRLTPDNGLNAEEVSKFEQLLEQGFKLLGEKAAKKIGRNTKIKIRNASAIIYHPWFLTEKKEDIRIGKQGEAHSVTEKAISDALNQTQLQAFEDGHAIAAYSYKKTIIEAFIDYVRLNGYSVANPIGKKAKDIVISASFYTASASLLECLKKEIHFHTNVEPRIQTFPKCCAIYSGLHTFKVPTLFVDVEDSTTTICSTPDKSSMIYSARSFDMGFGAVASSLAGRSGASGEIGYSYLRLLSEGMLSDAASVEIDGIIGESLSSWKSKLTYLLNEMGVTWQSRVILCRDHRFKSLYAKAINQDLVLDTGFKESTVEQVVFESIVGGV